MTLFIQIWHRGFNRLLCIHILFALFSTGLFAQMGADKQINPFHKRYADSLKTMEYNRVLPLLAKKAYKRGYDVPLPYGIGVVYFSLKQAIEITSTKIGFNDSEPIELNNIISYGEVINKSNLVTVRPDIWVLPFLNVYGIFGTGASEVNVPIVEPVNFSTTQHFSVKTAGAGLTLAAGLGAVFVVVDNNMAWVWLDVVEKPVSAYNLDMRIGHNFVHPRNPERTLAVWVGTFFQSLQSETIGNIPMSDIMDETTATELKKKLEDKINNDPDLGPVKKEVLTKIVDQGIDKVSTANVHYELDKKIAGPWNLIFGAQYQFNKHWQLRCEVGTFGDRSQFLLNLNFHF